jgi:hypothetical protein
MGTFAETPLKENKFCYSLMTCKFITDVKIYVVVFLAVMPYSLAVGH